MKFKQIAILIVLGGLGYAVYTGQVGGFLDNLGGTMGSTMEAAQDVE